MGQDQNAIADFSQALSLNSKTLDLSDLYWHRGKAYVNRKQYDAGIKDLTDAITLNGASGDAYHWRAHAYAHQGNFDHAIADFDYAIELAPSPELYGDRALVYEKNGDCAKAIADYRTILETTNDDSMRRKASDSLSALARNRDCARQQ